MAEFGMRNEEFNRRGRRARGDKNGQRPRGIGKKRIISEASGEAKTAKGLSWNDLCAFCLLSGHFVVFFRGGFTGRKLFIPKMRKQSITAETREDAESMKYP